MVENGGTKISVVANGIKLNGIYIEATLSDLRASEQILRNLQLYIAALENVASRGCGTSVLEDFQVSDKQSHSLPQLVVSSALCGI